MSPYATEGGLISCVYVSVTLFNGKGQIPLSNQIKSNQIYLPTQNMKEKNRQKPEVKQNEKNNDKLEC